VARKARKANAAAPPSPVKCAARGGCSAGVAGGSCWALARLIPYARNARTHTALQIAQLAESIPQWGWTMPILVGETGGIIADHGRALAADKLGIAECP
jgi:hypothetical protein